MRPGRDQVQTLQVKVIQPFVMVLRYIVTGNNTPGTLQDVTCVSNTVLHFHDMMLCLSSHIRSSYTGLCGGPEHLKTETRLIDERLVSVMGECLI